MLSEISPHTQSGGARGVDPRISTPGHGQEPHGIQSASTGPVPWVGNLHPTALPPSQTQDPHTTPTAWSSTCSETPSSEARSQLVGWCSLTLSLRHTVIAKVEPATHSPGTPVFAVTFMNEIAASSYAYVSTCVRRAPRPKRHARFLAVRCRCALGRVEGGWKRGATGGDRGDLRYSIFGGRWCVLLVRRPVWRHTLALCDDTLSALAQEEMGHTSVHHRWLRPPLPYYYPSTVLDGSRKLPSRRWYVRIHMSRWVKG